MQKEGKKHGWMDGWSGWDAATTTPKKETEGERLIRELHTSEWDDTQKKKEKRN